MTSPTSPTSPTTPAAPAPKAAGKRSKKVVESEAVAHISATFNNVLITITEEIKNRLWPHSALNLVRRSK